MTDFSHRLKVLRKAAHMNQAEVASAIGVAQTAIANYESGARFPSEERLVKLADLFKTTMDILLGREEPIQKDFLLDKYFCQTTDGAFFVKFSDDVIQLLIGGNKQEAMALVLSLQAGGISMQNIYHKVFQYVLYKTGWLWETGVIDVAMEHFISESLEQLMPLLKQKTHGAPPNGKRIVCFTPEGEDHVLANHMISDSLELEGFTTYFLGRNVPLSAAMTYIEQLKPDALVISITLMRNLKALEDLTNALAGLSHRQDFKVIVGGSPLKGITAMDGIDGIGISLEDTVRKVRALTIDSGVGGHYEST